MNVDLTALSVSMDRLRRAAMVSVTAVALLVTAQPVAAVAAAGTSTQAWRDVVVTGSGADGAARAVVAAGGRVLSSLPLVDGVAARLPQNAVLGADWFVAPQRRLQAAANRTPVVDGPVSPVRATLGPSPNGDEGRGVTVAVVDTGIANVPDLAGQVSGRVDMTGTGAGDGFGHGTFMAGLIAGTGTAAGGVYRGVAPAAKLVDVKVADAQGGTDLVTVLRGLQWIAEHSQQIDVVNLSLSSDSPLPYQLDPLTQGLEALWRRGVTVVVPSGNEGSAAGSVTSPGTDPVLLTAGGVDDASTGNHADDVVADWSGRGPTWQGDSKPDLVAPGAHVVSLRAPGSVVDTANPQARIGNGYFRGSGTSMATAVTSGVVAAALAVQPRLRPDSVKNLFVKTAYSAAGLTRAAGAGAGALDASRAIAAAPGWPDRAAEARADQDQDAISQDARQWTVFEQAIVAGNRNAAQAAWKKLSPESRDWAGRAWAALDPATRAWAQQTWSGRAWASGSDGTAEEWAGRAWAGRAWAGRLGRRGLERPGLGRSGLGRRGLERSRVGRSGLGV